MSLFSSSNFLWVLSDSLPHMSCAIEVKGGSGKVTYVAFTYLEPEH